MHPQVPLAPLRADNPEPKLARLRAVFGDFVALLESAALVQPFFVVSYNQSRMRLQIRVALMPRLMCWLHTELVYRHLPGAEDEDHFSNHDPWRARREAV